jgi:hypothetical protein
VLLPIGLLILIKGRLISYLVAKWIQLHRLVSEGTMQSDGRSHLGSGGWLMLLEGALLYLFPLAVVLFLSGIFHKFFVLELSEHH